MGCDPRCDIVFGSWIDAISDEKLYDTIDDDIIDDWYHEYYDDGNAFLGIVLESKDWNDDTEFNIIALAEKYKRNIVYYELEHKKVFKQLYGDAKYEPPSLNMICYMF